MKVRWPIWLNLISAASVLLVAHQNCTSVRLGEIPQPSLAANFQMDGTFCAGPNASGVSYHVSSFYIANLNLHLKNGIFKADSDIDGVLDEEESRYGMNPQMRRTNGKILDRLCLNLYSGQNCQQTPQPCNGTNTLGGNPIGIGLNDCDIGSLALNSFFNHPTQGLDTDKDGLLDLVEIIDGLSPNRNDADEDLDGDGIINKLEVARGSNPSLPDADAAADRLTQLTATIDVVPTVCQSEQWSFKLNSIPLVSTLSLNDSVNPELNHDTNENIILVYYKAIPTGAAPGTPAQIWGKIVKVAYDPDKNASLTPTMHLTPADFTLMGKVLP